MAAGKSSINGQNARVILESSGGVEVTPATSAQIGEVQASPTQYTVLDRLKALLTGIVLAAGNAIIGKVGIDQTTVGTTNGVVINPIAPVTQTLASAASGASVDISRVSVVTVQVTAYSGDGLLRGQVSNDGTNWTALSYYRDADGSVDQNIASTGLWTFAVPGHSYFRLQMVSWSSGSTTALLNGGQGTAEGIPVNARSLVIAGNADAQAGGFFKAFDGTQIAVGAIGYGWNGASNDRNRHNTEHILLASGERTTTQTSADLISYNARGLHVILSATAIGTGSITVSIQGKDANGIYYTILTGAAVVTDTVNRYTIHPSAPNTANVSVPDLVPRTFRIVVTANNANPATYSVGYNLTV